MNKYQEAINELKNNLLNDKEGDLYYEHCNGNDKYVLTKDEMNALQELVDNFGDFEATLDFLIKLTQKNMRTAYGRDFDYYNGVLDTLLKFKETFYKKEGK